MKNYIINLSIFFLLFISCNEKNKHYATIKYTKEIDFGTIHSQDTVTKTFKIKNISENSLKINQIKTSCGCTVAKVNDSIVKKNESTDIIVQFIADNDKIGKINKSVVIDANTNPNFTVLYLKGIVEKK